MTEAPDPTTTAAPPRRSNMGFAPKPEIVRFMALVEKTDTCWLWKASLTHEGYGRFKNRLRSNVSAHRWAYEHFEGAIPEGLQLDHLCRVRNCVNPEHLDPVTGLENLSRRPVRTHCKQGHELTPENTYARPSPHPESSRAFRVCRQCEAARRQARRDRRDAAGEDER